MTYLTTTQGAIAGRYDQLAGERFIYHQRAIDCAKLTLPYLVPPLGHSFATRYPTPYQAIGARGVNNLSSKLLLALMPPNSPFFRFAIDESVLVGLSGGQPVDMTAAQQGFSKMESVVTDWFDSVHARPKISEALKHLIIAGNVLLYVSIKGLRVFPISRFVCRRAADGKVLEVVVKEDMRPIEVDEALRARHGITNEKSDEVVGLFTHVLYDASKGMYNVMQELNGVLVEGSKGEILEDALPWLPLRWSTVDGEHYGRSYCEEYLGDLKSAEGLSKALLEAAAAASKVIFLLRPNASTNKRKLVEAPSGSIIEGNPEDISTLQLEKTHDFRVALERLSEIEKSLSFAFLNNTAIQRTQERVTAEEIRYMAGELEDALGGVYSILTQELQLRLVKAVVSILVTEQKLPPIPPAILKTSITTGLAALGRGQDLQKLSALVQQLSVFGPDVIPTYLNVADYITRVGTALGVDMQGLVKTQEQIQLEAQAQRQAEMNAQLAPIALQGGLEQQQMG